MSPLFGECIDKERKSSFGPDNEGGVVDPSNAAAVCKKSVKPSTRLLLLFPALLDFTTSGKFSSIINLPAQSGQYLFLLAKLRVFSRSHIQYDRISYS